MAVAIATPVLRDGDAVGNDVLGMGRVLRAAGYDVSYFSQAAGVSADCRPLEDLFRVVTDPDDVLIYHHSINCDLGVKAMEELPARRKIVKYHNVTPPRFFTDLSPVVAAGCAEGLRQVERLARTGATVWADSAFNAADFERAAPGLAVAELPPFHQVDTLLGAEPDTYAAGGLDDWNTLVLCVGRLAPNKNLLLAVDAFAAYRDRHDPDARLALVGEPFPGYYERVVRRIKGHGLSRQVLVTGKVTLGQLKALYLTADALLVTSEHEGFCVPLVEAMRLGTPIVAAPNAAVPGTAGDAARYAAAEAGPLADALAAVVNDRVGREELLARGAERFRERFTNEAVGRRFLALFEAAVN